VEGTGNVVVKNLDVGIRVGNAQVVQVCQVLEVSPPKNDFRFIAQIDTVIERAGIHVEHERSVED
jgi:rRNA pseudouridine-1189 N-methylase Emg1 (Nep1/Mra1 family)